jgi:steroid delta-isomerase-like uncharacterized protein
MSEANKAVIQRVIEDGGNKHDIAVLAELYRDCVYHSPVTGELKGEAYIRFMTSLFGAFPDLRITVEDQFAEGDKVVTRWNCTATHRKEFMGIAATGKPVKLSGMCIDRVVNGKIVEEWEEWDALGMMRQLGLVPAVHFEERVAA